MWFPFARSALEHCITETYAMVCRCYRKMITLAYGGEMSYLQAFPPAVRAGGAWRIAALTTPARAAAAAFETHRRHLSPASAVGRDTEKGAQLQALNERDVSIDYAFMVTMEKFVRHGCEKVPDYMLSGSRGRFYRHERYPLRYSADEVLYGALPDFEESLRSRQVSPIRCPPAEDGALHCMLPVFKEAKEGLYESWILKR